MTDDVTPALAALREFLAHTELPRGSTWASLRADLSFIVQAVADARRQALEEARTWLEARADEHERIAIERLKDNEEMALTHKSMATTYWQASRSICDALLPP